MSKSKPEKNLTCYLVGGAVRDELLGLPIKERDWVVVGATVQKMIDLGFTLIGKDFPVFLHPDTKEEYALARTERKSGKGYKGFTIFANKNVTLTQDLQRRDLRINAMAKDINGQLIDPYDGLKDIRNKTLRHVSSAFSEDPVRILRIARFAARFGSFGFTVDSQTMDLMKKMVVNGEADALVAERVWQELSAACLTKKPSLFFHVLRKCGALAILFPELNALFGVPQSQQHHPEIDTGIHTMMVIDRARELSDDMTVIYTALTHDLGKGLTPQSTLPSHHGHEAAGVPLVDNMSHRLRAPKEAHQLARITCEQHLNMHRLNELRSQTILKLLTKLDAFRRPERVLKFALACQADSQGRGGDFSQRPYPQREQLMQYFDAAKKVDCGKIAQKNNHPQQISSEISKARSNAIEMSRKQL